MVIGCKNRIPVEKKDYITAAEVLYFSPVFLCSPVLEYEPSDRIPQKGWYPSAEHRCGSKFLMGMESNCQGNQFFNIKALFCERQLTKLILN